MTDRLYNKFRKITSGTGQPSGRGVMIAVEAAGWVRLIGNTPTDILDVYVNAGTSELEGYVVRDWTITGVPGTAATNPVVTVINDLG